MDKIKIELPQNKKGVRRFQLNIPEDLFERMVNEGGVVKGKATDWILKAIEEKLDRDKTTE